MDELHQQIEVDVRNQVMSQYESQVAAYDQMVRSRQTVSDGVAVDSEASAEAEARVNQARERLVASYGEQFVSDMDGMSADEAMGQFQFMDEAARGMARDYLDAKASLAALTLREKPSQESGEPQGPVQQTALQRIPLHPETGEPMFEQAESVDAAWDALVEFSEGDASSAKVIADTMVEEKRKAFEKAQKLKPKGKTPAEILASQKANAAELAKAQAEFEYWQKMAAVEQDRKAAMRSQQEAEVRRIAAERAEAEKAERAAQEEAALNQDGQGWELRGNEPLASGEQTSARTEPSDSGAGVADDSAAAVGERGNVQSADERQSNLQSSEEIDANLSEEEKDEYGKPLVLAKDGTTTFGIIDAETGLTEAPIRLSLGENTTDNEGKNHGYGLLHIEAGHGDQIRNAGYASVEEFVEEVAKNYTDIREGALIGENQTYLLEVSDDHNNTLFIQLSNDGSYWNVNSAGIFRKRYSRRNPKVYDRPALSDGKSTDTTEVNSSQTEGATAPAGNSSQTSGSKDSESLAEEQISTSTSSEATRPITGGESFEQSSEKYADALNEYLNWINNKYGSSYSDIELLVKWAIKKRKGLVAIDRIADDYLSPDDSSKFKRTLRSYVKAIQAERSRKHNAESRSVTLIDSLSDGQTKEVTQNLSSMEKQTGVYLPVGNGSFGKIYDQFKGKVTDAISFLTKAKEGDLLGVFKRKGFGDVDLVWGDVKSGWCHILDKHVGEGKSFASPEEAANAIDDIIKTGDKVFENGDKAVFEKDGKLVTVRKNLREKGKKIADKNWVLTAYDENSADGTTGATRATNQGQAAQTAELSGGKVNTLSSDKQESSEESSSQSEVAQPITNEKNQLDKGRKTAGKKFQSEHEYIDSQIAEAYERRTDKSVDRKEWDESDEYEVVYNKAADGYGDYIRTLAESGELQRMFDEGSVGDRIKIREGVDTAGLRFNELVDTSKEKAEGRARRESAKKRRMAEVMSAIGIGPDGNIQKQVGESGNGNREVYEAAKGLLERVGISVHEVSSEEAQAMLGKGDGLRMSAAKRRALDTLNGGSAQQSNESELRSNDHQDSITRFDDSANVQNNLKELANMLEEKNASGGTIRDFISVLSKALGLRNNGNHSNYGTFEAKNGAVVRIRVSDHNAQVKNFDDAGYDNGISIVVTRKANEGLDNNGEAHIVEYYYNGYKLARADGHPLAEIARSLQQVLYSGEFRDTTGLAERQEVNGDDIARFSIKTYHGTGADFDAFDFSHMGEGEGVQAYGWGGYVTEVKGIGKTYATQIAGGSILPKIEKAKNNIRQVKSWLKDNQDWDKYERKALRHLRELQKELKSAKREGNESDVDFYQGLIELQEASLNKESHSALIVEKLGQIDGYEREVKALEDELSKNRHLYTVKIPSDRGVNYLDWDARVSDEQKQMIGMQAAKEGVEFDFFGDKLDANTYFEKMGGNGVGFQMYRALIRSLGSDRAASEFLLRAGLTGIKYAADHNNGGRADGKRNYVVFKESDMKISDHIRFLRAGGEVYGWTVGGEVWLNRDAMNPETPMHEYTHLWDAMVQRENPALWARGVELMKQTPVWAEVVSDPNYADIREDEDAVASEVHSRLMGERGARILDEMIEKSKRDGAMAVAESVSLVDKLRGWLRDMFSHLKATLGKWSKRDLRNLTEDQFIDMPLRDLADGLNPKHGDKTMAGVESVRFHAAKSREKGDVEAVRDRAEPTEGQKKAGNYKMGHRRVDGYDISIENEKGSIRRGKDANGTEWESEMHNDYGYIRGTEGVDGDHIDVFLSDTPEQGNVYVVDQYNPDGSFDEHKVMYGFADGKAAREAYLSNYEQGWDQSRRLDVTGVSKEEFKKWIQSSKRKTKPFADYVNVKKEASETTTQVAEREKQSFQEDQVADRIEALFDEAVAGNLTGKPVEVGKLTADGKSYLERLSGMKLKDEVSFVLNPSDLVHMYRDHYGINEKDKGNNIPLTKDDIRAISKVIAEPERVIFGIEPDGLKRKLFYFLAPAAEGTYNLLEIYGDRKGNLTAKTFYKTKKAVSQRVLSLMKSEHLTSVTDGASLSDAKLPKFFEYPKSEVEEDLRFRDGSDVHGAIEEYKRKYPSAEITVIASEGEIAELPVAEEIKKGLKELHSDAETLAAYCRVDKKIYIFAGRNQAGEIEESLLHENIHAVCDRLSGAEYELLSSIAEKLSAVTEGGNILGRLYAGIVSAYDRKDVAEEMIVYSLQYARSHPEIMDSIYETLDEAERDLIDNKILKEVYGREEGREADVYSGEGKRLQQADGSDQRQRERAGGVGERTGAVVAEDAWGREWGESQRLIDEAESAAAAEHQAKVDRIRELSERLHLDNVDIVADGSGLSGRRAKAKGWYSRRTGRITIVVGNNVSVADVERTLLHEAVAHYGLRQLLGSRFEGFLDDVYASASAQVRARIVELAKSRGWDFRTATEEYLAGLAEDMAFERHGAERGWWDRVKEMFCRLLGDIGFKSFVGEGVELSDSELRYMLWSSYEHLRDPANYRSVMGEAADVAMQSELQVGEFAAEVSEESVGMESELEKVNARFNEQLQTLTQDNADKVQLSLGRPSALLRAAGISDRPLKLYGNKVIKKMKKHGFSLEELQDLPKAIESPIAVFDNIGREGNRSILTELRTAQGNFLVTVDLGKGGEDVDFNIVSSVFGKSDNKVADWILKGYATYMSKEKVLNYLHHSAPIAEALSNSRLENAAKIVEKFENPAVDEAENDDGSIGGTLFDQKGYISDVNARFNEQLSAFADGSMAANEFIDVGQPTGVLRMFMPELPIILRQKVLRKALNKHGMSTFELLDLPQSLAHPIFVFKKTDKTIGVLTSLKASNGKNVFVAIELEVSKQMGHRVMSVNDVLSVHDREYENVVLPILENGTLQYVDKIKGLDWLSSAKTNSQAIASQTLEDAAKIVEKFENPAVEEAENEDLFRDGDFSVRDRAIARDNYNRICSEGSFQVREALQDSMLGLRVLYEAVLGKGTRIEDVSGAENAYLCENRLSSMNAAHETEYTLRYANPLIEEIGRIAGRSEDESRALRDYVMAKHGLERNDRMRSEAQAQGKNPDRDFAGLTGLTGRSDWRDAESAARQLVADYEARHNTSELWRRINAATEASLERMWISGLLSTSDYGKIKGMYQYYVPLRGWEEDTGDDVYGYISHYSGGFVATDKVAKGRSSKADDPIATIMMMASAAIRQGNRNVMKQRFLNFVQNHPSDLTSVNEVWLQYDAALGEWQPVFADITPDMSAAEVSAEVDKFEQKMEALAAADPAKYKRGSDAVDIPFRVINGHLREHQVMVKRGGVAYVITINGNPRAAQALNGLTNPDVGSKELGPTLASVVKAGTRTLSSLYTTRNPNFVANNFVRDSIYCISMTLLREGRNYWWRFLGNMGKCNPAKMYGMLMRWEEGTLARTGDDALFAQFMRNGGETGYTSIRDIEGYKREIVRELASFADGSMTANEFIDWPPYR